MEPDVLDLMLESMPFLKVDMWVVMTGLFLMGLIVFAYHKLADIFCFTDADLKHQTRKAQEKRNSDCDDKQWRRDNGV